MSIFTQNFNTLEQQPLAVTASNSQGAFTTGEGINADDMMVVNEGPNGVQIITGNGAQTAVVKASAAATKQTRVPAGAVMIIGKGTVANFAAICESGQTAQLYLHAGKGS